MSLPENLHKDNIPEHIAIIMDGNGRWAKEQGKNRVFGHRSGVTSVKSVVEGAAELGVKNLTLYAFSSENWSRPKSEVNALMQLLVNSINRETKTLNKNNIRLMAIGELSNLPSSCQKALLKAIDETKGNSHMNLILALSYSSRWELAVAVKKMVGDAMDNKFKLEDINEELIQNYLTTADLPNPELLIRTSGEMRISNFLLWQIAYSELYFTKKNWPDFRKEDLIEAIIDYQQRERRFGKISEQMSKNG
ncbi:MAG: isoprenyl transferase [Vicingaceae bacterium]